MAKGCVAGLEPRVPRRCHRRELFARDRLVQGLDDIRRVGIEIEHGASDPLVREEPERFEAASLAEEEAPFAIEREEHDGSPAQDPEQGFEVLAEPNRRIATH